MSGIEVVGLVLGVLPLLVSALEHYEDTLRPIKTYRNFATKVQQFHDQLETQRTIFCAECELLLSVVADRATAREMLNDPNHEKWRNAAIRDLFGRYLGLLGTACASVITNMNKKLVEIGNFSKSFDSFPSAQTDGSSISKRDWAKRVRSKLRLTFSEPKLRESIADLEALNTTFQTLSNQVVRFEEQVSSQEKRSRSMRSVATERKTQDLKKFQIVRMAAHSLYDCLSKACTVHAEHVAKFCLEASCLGMGGLEKIPSQVRFKLTYSHLQLAACPLVPSAPPTQFLRFEVESLLGDEQSICDFCESRMLKAGYGGAPMDQLSKKEKEKEIIERSTGVTAEGGPSSTRITAVTGKSSSSVSDVPMEELAPSSSNHSTRSLCVELQESNMERESSLPSTYITMLEQSTTSNHLIYYPTQSSLSNLEDPSISLTQALGSISGSSGVGIPFFLRLSIARSLSVAVLQFHTTPWFEDSWMSENVCFFEDKSKPGLLLTDLPHLVVRMVSDEDNDASPKTRSNSSRGSSIAPNTVLFILGIMLLELAYGSPFHCLLEPGDLEVSEDVNVINFKAATRLAHGVEVHLGPRYARLVRKCLRCDFGSGEDLDDFELQERLYEDVICQLEGLEQGLRCL